MLVDTHCHLDFDWFDKDRDQVVRNAVAADVQRIVNPGINLASSKKTILIAEKHDQVFAAVGVHPNDGSSWRNGTLDQLRNLALQPKVIAIGEIGLDYYRDYTPHDIQKRIFKDQLVLAAELDLPVIIHSRDSMKDVMLTLAEWQQALIKSGSELSERPGVLHSFSGDEDDAQQAIERNFFVGITGPVTFKNARNIQELVIRLPIQKLLVETDSPFLTPHPHRGKRNEPANVKLVAEKIAQLRQESYDSIKEITSDNASRLFQW